MERTNPRHNQTHYRNLWAYHNAVLRYDTKTRAREYREIPFRSYQLNRDGLLASGRTTNSDRDIALIVSQYPNTPYLLGIEIEVEGCSGRSDSDKTEDVALVLDRHLRGQHICVPDGSLHGGLEIVTAPIAPNAVNRIGWYKLLRALSRVGLTAHENTRCGLHINVSRKYLTDDTWRKLRSFLVSRGTFFRALSRRTSFGYSAFSRETTKYTALNLSKSSVCEFRFFRGTLKPSSFIASIEIVRALVEYAHDVEIAGSKRLTTKGFLNVLKRFPVAYAYAIPHLELLKRKKDPNAPKRARVTNEEATRQALTYIRQRAVASIEVQSDGSLSWIIRDSRAMSPYQTVEYNAEPVVYTLPIVWPTNLPSALRVAKRRGLLPSTIQIGSSWRPLSDMARVNVSYSGGGWGQTGTFRFYVNHS